MSSHTIIGACPLDCPDTCSMLVSVEEGKVTGVRGNPDHPITRGRLCVKMNDYEKRVYHPDRVLTPLRRLGPKGTGQFEPISWETALEEISGRWKEIIRDHGAKSILPYSYLGTQGILNGLNVGDAFFNRMGATVGERTFCDSGACTAYAMTIGDSAAVDPESVVHSRFIILWANNMLATNSHMWPIVMEARKRGAKLVVIDPMRTAVARAADWHIAPRPGTDGALALGLVNLLISEGLLDQDYIDAHTMGFEELRERARDYPLEKVAGITGLEPSEILQLAHEYGSAHAPLIRIGVAIERHAGGGQTVRAIACLPALVGAWRQPGGGLLQLPIWAFPVNWGALMRPDLYPDEPKVLNLWKLADALNGSLPDHGLIRSLMVYNSNPVITAPEQAKMIKGLMRSDLFTVVSDHFVTDTAKFADIVLPATTQVEQEDIMFSWGHMYLSYNNPAVPPLGEAVSNTELFRRLAAAMGYDDDPCFSMSDAEMIARALDWEHPVLEGITLEALKATGFMRLNLAHPDAYAPHAEGAFHTSSGKCEFRAAAAEMGNFVVPLFRQGHDAEQPGDPVDPLPHYIPPRESPETNPELAARFPLSLISPKSHPFLSSSFGNMERQASYSKGVRLFLHPEDAAPRGIASGQQVRVFNDRGSFTAQVELTDDLRPGVASAPVGFWRDAANPNTVHAVTSRATADLGEAPTFSDVLVQVEALPQAAE
ncbi:molybdopterin-dependent oxidoreductase (plasmid) [Thioclava sp. 'Guangxiensis']|uniref:molybdopterin-containing oxidoreductase family protein n=1 Tax=Thioclava sp. 'Guangxiensis' TaxID=3149044 RepID=UPI0032C435C9